MSTRTPEASPYRHHQNHYRYVDPTTGQSHSPESDVGYGTSFGSQDFNGHNIDIDSISNLLVIYLYIICCDINFWRALRILDRLQQHTYTYTSKNNFTKKSASNRRAGPFFSKESAS